MRQGYHLKHLSDGRTMLNLGCGTRMNWDWNNVDFSPYAWLAHHMAVARILRRVGALSEERFQKLLGVDPQIMVWDLRRGVPFEDDTFDVVYHSHLLEHLDRRDASSFLKECHRVLKQSGIIRVVVPDLQLIIKRYVSSISRLEAGDKSALADHKQTIHDLFDQMVRKWSAGTKQQNFPVRLMERIIRGEATRTGELHRWMWDRYTLEELLSSIGFTDIRTEMPFSSRIEGWHRFHIDTNEDGNVWKPGSLYIEGVKQQHRGAPILGNAGHLCDMLEVGKH
jgi:SAM-dependent methyltransferase